MRDCVELWRHSARAILISSNRWCKCQDGQARVLIIPLVNAEIAFASVKSPVIYSPLLQWHVVSSVIVLCHCTKCVLTCDRFDYLDTRDVNCERLHAKPYSDSVDATISSTSLNGENKAVQGNNWKDKKTHVNGRSILIKHAQ